MNHTAKLEKKVIEKLLARGMTKTEVAAQLGVTRQAIYHCLKSTARDPKPTERKVPEDVMMQEAWKTSGRNLPVNKEGRFLPAGYIKSDIEMEEIAVTDKPMLYSKEVDSGERVARLVHDLIYDLADVGEPINFNNTDQVKRVALRYLSACEAKGTIPSAIGLARSCGCSQAAIPRFIARHPGHPSAQFLQLTLDAMSEALQQATLSGSVKEVYSIFLQKAMYNMRDNAVLARQREDPLGETATTDSIIDKYADLGDD